MAARTRVKVAWKRGAFAELRTSPGVMAQVDRTAQAMADRAGPGYEAKPAKKTGGRVRGRAAVIPTTHDAIRDQAKNHTLERVVTQKVN